MGSKARAFHIRELSMLMSYECGAGRMFLAFQVRKVSLPYQEGATGLLMGQNSSCLDGAEEDRHCLQICTS